MATQTATTQINERKQQRLLRTEQDNTFALSLYSNHVQTAVVWLGM